MGTIIMDVLHAEDDAALQALIGQSIAWWKGKGYKLISNKTGTDIALVKTNATLDSSGKYEPATVTVPYDAEVILVFERV